MSELGFNKVAGAVLATGLAVLGLRELSAIVYHQPQAEKPGYAIQVAETSTEAAPVADVPPDWGTVLPAADVNAGQAQSAKCQSCHTFTKGGANGTGPNQWNLVGRKPGVEGGFDYSSAMKDFGAKNPAWTYDLLYKFIKEPQTFISGTKMTFVGIKSPQDRINLIAWLRTQADSPAPIPAPSPKAAAAGPGPSSAPAAVTGKPGAAQPTVAGTGAPGTDVGAQSGAPSSGAAAAPAAIASAAGKRSGAERRTRRFSGA